MALGQATLSKLHVSLPTFANSQLDFCHSVRLRRDPGNAEAFWTEELTTNFGDESSTHHTSTKSYHHVADFSVFWACSSVRTFRQSSLQKLQVPNLTTSEVYIHSPSNFGVSTMLYRPRRACQSGTNQDGLHETLDIFSQSCPFAKLHLHHS